MNRQRPQRDHQQDDELEQDDYLVQGKYYVPTAQPTRAPRPPQRERDYGDKVQARRRKPRRAWPWLLLGCAGGIVVLLLAVGITLAVVLRGATGGNLTGLPGSIAATNYTQSGQLPLTFTTLSLLQINDAIGNVTVTVDPNVTSPALAYVKRVKAGSSSAANTEFSKMSVQASPLGNTALTVKANVPSSDVFSVHNDAIDLTLTLPQSAFPAAAAQPFALSATVSIGNINVTGASGVLNLTDQFGNVTVNQAALDDGSHLSTNAGNVIFSGSINTTPAAGSTAPLYKLQSETGNITATLPSDTNVTLDANTNLGKITSDFPIPIKNSSGGASYYGPLLSNSTAAPPAVLTLDVSTGNVTLHQG